MSDRKNASSSTSQSPLNSVTFIQLLHMIFFPSLFIDWTLFIGFQKCFPNNFFRKYKKEGSRLVEAGKAPVKSMGLSWGTGPLWVLTEAFYVLQRGWVMQRSQETSLCLQFAKIIAILAVPSQWRLMVGWQFWIKEKLSGIQITLIAPPAQTFAEGVGRARGCMLREIRMYLETPQSTSCCSFHLLLSSERFEEQNLYHEAGGETFCGKACRREPFLWGDGMSRRGLQAVTSLCPWVWGTEEGPWVQPGGLKWFSFLPNYLKPAKTFPCWI